MKTITGFFMAWGNFCAIPCPCKRWDEGARKHMLVMFPVIGLLMGVLWYLLSLLVRAAGLPVSLAAAIMTAYPFLISGFIHLDGFMDCNDAILSRRPLQERQRILKDSHVGAFAVITSILLFLVFFAAMEALMEKGTCYPQRYLIVVPVFARVIPAINILTQRPLSASQYEKSFDPQKSRGFKWALIGVWVASVLLLAGISGYAVSDQGAEKALIAAAVLAAAQLISSAIGGAYARKQLGGMNGDIAGYTLVWSELAAVVALSIIK